MMLLLLLTLTALAAAAPQARCQTTHAPQGGPTALWRADGNADDSSGNGNHGTPLGQARYTPGLSGEAFDLNGRDESVKTTVDTHPENRPSMTWSAWILPRKIGAKRQILSSDNGDYKRSLLLLEDRFAVFTGGNLWETSETAEPGVWQHVAIVFDGTELRFYKNGNESYYGNNVPTGETVAPLCIGRNPAFGEHFGGLIDEVEIYDRALSANEITAIYEKLRAKAEAAPAEDTSNSHDLENGCSPSENVALIHIAAKDPGQPTVPPSAPAADNPVAEDSTSSSASTIPASTRTPVPQTPPAEPPISPGMRATLANHVKILLEVGGRKAGNATLPANTEVSVVEVANSRVRIRSRAGEAWVDPALLKPFQAKEVSGTTAATKPPPPLTPQREKTSSPVAAPKRSSDKESLMWEQVQAAANLCNQKEPPNTSLEASKAFYSELTKNEMNCLLLYDEFTRRFPSSKHLALPQDETEAWTHAESFGGRGIIEEPSEWSETPPTEKERQSFSAKWAEINARSADLYAEFIRHFPEGKRYMSARQWQVQCLSMAVMLGREERAEELKDLTASIGKDSRLFPELRLKTQLNQINYELKSMSPSPGDGDKSIYQDFANRYIALQKDFPESSKVNDGMVSLARCIGGGAGRSLAQAVLDSPVASERSRQTASDILAGKIFNPKANIGKPIDIKFTALDGSEVDLEKMKGKVILVEFWATWCSPCVAGIPEIQEVYERYHKRGLEIIGISLDTDRETLIAFIKGRGLQWPQRFDGRDLAERFNILGIPTLWLIDKDGNLADINARADMDKKVTDLLANKRIPSKK